MVLREAFTHTKRCCTTSAPFGCQMSLTLLTTKLAKVLFPPFLDGDFFQVCNVSVRCAETVLFDDLFEVNTDLIWEADFIIVLGEQDSIIGRFVQFILSHSAARANAMLLRKLK